MPDPFGKCQGKGMVCSTSSPRTLATGSNNEADLAALIASSGPVKNTAEAKAFLDQRVLVAVNNNFTYETLANILFTTALKNKLPNHLASTIKAVGFLIINKPTQGISTDLSGKITEKMLLTNQPRTQLPQGDVAVAVSGFLRYILAVS